MEDISRKKDGHFYVLESPEHGFNQQLRFIEKEVAPDGSGFMVVQDGTTNEEVIKVLIDRCQKLNTKLPSKETTLAIIYLQQALSHLEERTTKRKEQGVEGTEKPHKE